MASCCTIVVGVLAVLLALFFARTSGPINYLVRRATSIEIVHGVHLPYTTPQAEVMAAIFNFNVYTAHTVVKGGVTKENKLPEEIIGKSKSSTDDIFEHMQKVVTKNLLKECKHDPDLVPDYLYFGNKKFSKSLPLFLKESPFFTWLLTAGKEGGQEGGESYLQLQAYDEDDPEKDLGTFYSSFAHNIYGKHRLFNIRLNVDMEITRMAYYDKEAKKTVVIDEKDWDYYASAALFNTKLFGQSVHTIIHVFHYILTSAIVSATEHDISLSTWASPYPKNIPVKYVEVAALLIRPEISWLFDSLFDAFVVPETNWAVTGSESMTAAVQKDLFEIFTIWGKCKTAEDFIDKFLLRDLYSSPNGKELAEKAGILKEFKKIAANIGPYAKDLTEAMKKDDPKAFETAEEVLEKYIKHTGDAEMEVSKISHFIELMSVSGIMHGSTLSHTRTSLIPEVMRWKNDYKEEWDDLTWKMINIGIGTISGAEPGRHVFMSKDSDSDGSPIKDWDTSKIAKNTLAVMEEYDAKVEKIKEANKAALLKDPRFREYGWILTDWCPDGFDAKQMTITTYI